MEVIRPFYNLFAYIRSIPRLPAAGASINILYAAFLSGNKSVFAELLKQACSDWSCKGYDYLSVGFCEDNELSSIASRYATQRIASTMYIVYWQDSGVLLPATNRPVHLEIATL